jgi:dTDP-4-amino-4,6-dideoxygalactose transaminase
MQNIQMVDLATQLRNIRGEVDQAIQEVLDSNAFINGPQVHRFARKLGSYLGGVNVVPCANGTDALQIAMMGLGLEPGDEVITPTFTYISTVEVIALLGLKPVLVDVDPHNFTLDPDAVEQAVTPRTKAIVPVHLFGQSAAMSRIQEIAEANGLWVIEDVAQAIGAQVHLEQRGWWQAGTIGHAAGISFYPSKNLGAYGDAGAVMSPDSHLAGAFLSIANHGQQDRYYFERVGLNSRLDTLQAAILEVKLKYLDHYIARRQQAAARYDDGLSAVEGIQLPKRNAASTHVFHQYTIRIFDNKRDGLQAYLAGKGIPSVIFYPVPVHLQAAYKNLGYQKRHFPVAEQLSAEVLSLPMHSELTEEQQEWIIQQIKAYLN